MPQVSPQVSQIAPAAADVRPAPQRKGDGFAQLLDTVDAATPERDAARAHEADDAEPVRTRRRTDHAGRRNDTRADRQDAKTGADKSDNGQDQTPASGDTKTADVSAADQPKEHKDAKSGKDGKDAADTTVDPQVVENVQAPDVKVAAVQAVVAPAPAVPAGTNDAPVQPVDAPAGIEAPQPQQAVPQPAQAAPQTAPNADAAQFDAAAAASAAQPAAKGTTDAPPQTVQDGSQSADPKAAAQAAKNAATPPLQTNNAAPVPPQLADAAPKAEPPALPNLPAMNTDANTKAAGSDASTAKPPETLENALARQFGGQFGNNVQVTDGTPITLPDAARALQNHLTPASLAVQTSASAATNQPVPLQNAALAIEIAARATNGSRQFEIRLDPPELGRIDVKLDVDKGGNVNTHLTVDRPETLDLLRRDAQGLERALQQAGLKTSDGNLEFSLRQQTPDGFNQRGQGQAQQGGNANGLLAADTDTANTVHAEYQWAARLRGGVDIRV